VNKNKIFLGIIFLFLLVIVPESVLSNAVLETTNEYDLYCYENNNNTAASFYRVFLYFLRFFYAVFFIWFLVHVINYHKEIA